MTSNPFATGGLKTGAAILIIATASYGTLTTMGDTPDEQAVRSVIDSAYFHGAFNEQNTTAMAQGFHEDFAIFSPQGDELSRYEIATWIEGIKARRSKPDFDPNSTKMDCTIVTLDVTGGAACAKVEMRKDGQLIYTDYLSVLKFDSGWKIAAKIYHRHPA